MSHPKDNRKPLNKENGKEKSSKGSFLLSIIAAATLAGAFLLVKHLVLDAPTFADKQSPSEKKGSGKSKGKTFKGEGKGGKSKAKDSSGKGKNAQTSSSSSSSSTTLVDGSDDTATAPVNRTSIPGDGVVDSASPSSSADEASQIEVVEIPDPDLIPIFAKHVTLTAQDVAPPPPGTLKTLDGLSFCVSENSDLAGTVTSYHAFQASSLLIAAKDGSENDEEVKKENLTSSDSNSTCPNSSSYALAEQRLSVSPYSASPITTVLSRGAVCVGKTSMQPLGLDVLGLNFGNPLNKLHIAGGGHTGAAAAVATGLCDFALASESLFESRAPAACTGVFCYRATPG
eukprot:CAMPEP_0175055208 /NCGR_PEP_ID=MMETSP0052_2-20121109/9948_1 /TAXON_ID=51329 ORGANISM="Polytomella parva, Strain SAG 63-3" /NCGR_SAMPLE_ID=MMETSP0052_2 /ASSEMBLY_ACC=CAM_ASM_000194 /LENGTH=342 /DNA_ID=CAMNT_0016320019 /DNA_START=91 /DNA_END=1115 /DNA_ORIENTATION=-